MRAIWDRLKCLFAPHKGIPPAMNRKERRLRQAVARKVRLHKVRADLDPLRQKKD